MILKYLREALELRKQAKDLYKAEKRLEKSELDYLMLENIIKGTNKSKTVNIILEVLLLLLKKLPLLTLNSFIYDSPSP